MLTGRMDGGCWRNPGGPGSCACLIKRNETEVYRTARILNSGPGMTNNVAEFEGMKLILEWLLADSSTEPAHIISDSQIVINRMTGRSKKPPVGSCAEIANECRLLLYRVRVSGRSMSFEWQRRASNDECDRMCSDKMNQFMRSARSPPTSDKSGFAYGSEHV